MRAGRHAVAGRVPPCAPAVGRAAAPVRIEVVAGVPARVIRIDHLLAQERGRGAFESCPKNNCDRNNP
jgi:hypothetical protein